jgi:hypothetical protein
MNQRFRELPQVTQNAFEGALLAGDEEARLRTTPSLDRAAQK